MKAFQEITAWDSDFAVPNHVYFLSDGRDKMYGYVRACDGVVQTMRSPYRFHVRGRKFREVENVWNFGVEEVSETRGKEHKVLGSKGTIYTVTDEGGAWSCTCPAAKWSKGSECKHIVKIKSETVC